MTRFTQISSRFLLAPILVTAAAILVRGYVSTGDGFAAGVVASIGILIQYVTSGRRRVESVLPVKHAGLAVSAGLLVALTVVFEPAVWNRALLSHVPAPDEHVVHFGALELHTAVVFDVGVFLIVFGSVVSMLHWIARPAKEFES